MPVVKFKHWSGPFSVTTSCQSSTKFQVFIVPDILKNICNDPTNPLAWMNYFHASRNPDSICGVANRLIQKYYLDKPQSRYFKKAPTVYRAAKALYNTSAVDHYPHVAAAIALLAKIGLLTYDQSYSLEVTVDNCDGQKPLTPQQIVGLADAYAYMKTEFNADIQEGISRANTTVNLGKHDEEHMGAWVSDMVPSIVQDYLNNTILRIEQHVTHFTANGSYNSQEHYRQLRRLFAAYLCSDTTEWVAHYSFLKVPDALLRMANFWSELLVEDPKTKHHRLPRKEECEAIFKAIEYKQGMVEEAIDRVTSAMKKGALTCNGTDVLDVVRGSEFYSRTAPFVPLIAEGIRLPAFDAHAPVDVTHVALIDIDTVSGNYGHSFTVDNGITTNVSAFVHDEFARLVKVYDDIKRRYAQQNALSVATLYLDKTTQSKVEAVPVDYLLDAVLECDRTYLMSQGSDMVISRDYNGIVEASLLALGFTKVSNRFIHPDLETALTAYVVAEGFPYIKNDPWYGIDLADSKLKTPTKQYQDSFRNYMEAQKLFVTLNPNNKDAKVSVHIPGSKQVTPHELTEFAYSIGLSREALVIREHAYKTLVAHFFDALKSIVVPLETQVEIDISDIILNSLNDFAKMCKTKFGDRSRVLVEDPTSNSTRADSTLEAKLDRKRATCLTAIDIYINLVKLVAPELADVTEWLYTLSQKVALENHCDFTLNA